MGPWPWETLNSSLQSKAVPGGGLERTDSQRLGEHVSLPASCFPS